MSAWKFNDIVTIFFTVSVGFAPDPTGALPLDPAGGFRPQTCVFRDFDKVLRGQTPLGPADAIATPHVHITRNELNWMSKLWTISVHLSSCNVNESLRSLLLAHNMACNQSDLPGIEPGAKFDVYDYLVNIINAEIKVTIAKWSMNAIQKSLSVIRRQLTEQTNRDHVRLYSKTSWTSVS